MRLGVLTFHRAINYGSCWQARALVEGLARLGHRAEIIDHRSRAVDWKEWRCALDPVPGARNFRQDYRHKTRALMAASAALPRTAPVDLEAPPPLPHEAVIVGSDEVWNPRHPWYGGVPFFHGAGIAGRRIAYAASFGHHPAEAGLSDWAAEALGRFDRLSVRDQNSWRLVGEATGLWPEIVLDPCLVFPEPLLQTVADPSAGREERPYLLVYGHDFPRWFSDAAHNEASRRGWRVIAGGYHAGFADENRVGLGPDAFLRLVAGAEAVVTNFFHGMVFSLLLEKPVAVAPSDYRDIKLSDLTQQLGIPGRRVQEPGDAGGMAGLLSEPAELAETLAALRRQSREYLQDAL